MKWLVLALALAATPAFAECKTAGSAEAKAVDALPEGADAGFNKALAAATLPAAVNAANEAVEKACKRPSRFNGENGDTFPRIRKGASHDDIAYLAPIPLKAGGKTVTYYALVNSFGSGAVLMTGLFDAIPTEDTIKKVLTTTIVGGFEPLEFDATTGKLVDKNIYLPGQLKKAARAAK